MGIPAAVRILALALFCLAALPCTAQTGLRDANSFTLSGHRIHVAYASTGIDGRPQLDYTDSHVHLHFSGTDVITEETAFGTLVSGVVHRTVDTGATLFTVIVPHVKVVPGGAAPVETFGFFTIQSFGSGPFLRGQLDHYTVVRLSGTARYLVF